MSKKILTTLLASAVTVALGIFTVSNAFALNYYKSYGLSYALSSQKPLSIQLGYQNECQLVKESYGTDVEKTKAKGLSVQMTKEQVQLNIDSVTEYRDTMCASAGDSDTLERLCKELKKTQGKEIKRIKAKGLSTQLSQTVIKKMVKNVKTMKKLACEKAKAAAEQDAE